MRLGVTPALAVIGVVHTAGTKGYWLIAADGGVFAFGRAPFAGSLPAAGVKVDELKVSPGGDKITLRMRGAVEPQAIEAALRGAGANVQGVNSFNLFSGERRQPVGARASRSAV